LQKAAGELAAFMPKFFRHMYPYIFKSIKVPPSQVFALMTLEEEKVCTLSSLSKKLNVSPPTASGLIDRLAQRGYVQRQQDEKDRRVVNISLTSTGDIVVKRFRNNILEKWKSLIKTFSPSERKGPLSFIKQILREIERDEKEK